MKRFTHIFISPALSFRYAFYIVTQKSQCDSTRPPASAHLQTCVFCCQLCCNLEELKNYYAG
ncbi:ST-I family heat-stable enterotoxin [Tengunoibacter tsumagoiensis]|uniref:ST-I family heat-stable enterotoxin n=1 Tax=Tengunoibacter tsumagoiensis TaxID=2014871 RepID=UPI000F82E45C